MFANQSAVTPDRRHRKERNVWRVRVFLLTLALIAGLGCDLPAQAPDPSQVIKKISIEGLKRESEADLLASLRIRVGDDFSNAKVSEATGQLWITGKFKTVDADYFKQDDGVEIIFKVAERPTVVSVRFQGRKALSESHLKTATPSIRTRVGAPT